MKCTYNGQSGEVLLRDLEKQLWQQRESEIQKIYVQHLCHLVRERPEQLPNSEEMWRIKIWAAKVHDGFDE